jgi:hypothetical protein
MIDALEAGKTRRRKLPGISFSRILHTNNPRTGTGLLILAAGSMAATGPATALITGHRRHRIFRLTYRLS